MQLVLEFARLELLRPPPIELGSASEHVAVQPLDLDSSEKISTTIQCTCVDLHHCVMVDRICYSPVTTVDTQCRMLFHYHWDLRIYCCFHDLLYDRPAAVRQSLRILPKELLSLIDSYRIDSSRLADYLRIHDAAKSSIEQWYIGMSDGDAANYW